MMNPVYHAYMALTGQTAVTDKLTELVDLIESINDPAARSAAYIQAVKWTRDTLPKRRDRAVYEARDRYAADALADMLGVEKGTVYFWTDRHREVTGAPRLRSLHRDRDLTNAVRLTTSLQVHPRG